MSALLPHPFNTRLSCSAINSSHMLCLLLLTAGNLVMFSDLPLVDHLFMCQVCTQGSIRSHTSFAVSGSMNFSEPSVGL